MRWFRGRQEKLAPGVAAPATSGTAAYELLFSSKPLRLNAPTDPGSSPTWPLPGAEPIRLVIWDLDDTFWNGTLTEGGISWVERNAELVGTLARRGILSSICSRNDEASVFSVLQQHEILDYFVFPDVGWDAKGPRLAALVEAVQLRPASILFIDDNPANLAEAKAYVPALQVAPAACIPTLGTHPLLQGKPDPDLMRLGQYRTLSRRNTVRKSGGGDAEDFLRRSAITVEIEHELDEHLDRIVELINRTNQLNFTKIRLPEDPGKARRELASLLSQHNVQAGLLRVRDAFGDHGYAAFYLLKTAPHPELVHFVFSCRLLGMGIETWLYRRLGKPLLRIRGETLTNPATDDRDIDWVAFGRSPGKALDVASCAPRYVLARGACDIRAITHYFRTMSAQVVEELQVVRGSQIVYCNHALLAMQAIDGFPQDAIADFAPLGFTPDDLHSALAAPNASTPAVWLMGFSVEQSMPVYRHKKTGALLPMVPAGLNISAAEMMRGEPCGVDAAIVAHLRDKFELIGRPDRVLLTRALQTIFRQASEGVSIFVLLSNTEHVAADGTVQPLHEFRAHNALISSVASKFPMVTLIDPRDFIGDQEVLQSPHHFPRIVYYRIYKSIMRELADCAKAGTPPEPLTRECLP